MMTAVMAATLEARSLTSVLSWRRCSVIAPLALKPWLAWLHHPHRRRRLLKQTVANRLPAAAAAAMAMTMVRMELPLQRPSPASRMRCPSLWRETWPAAPPSATGAGPSPAPPARCWPQSWARCRCGTQGWQRRTRGWRRRLWPTLQRWARLAKTTTSTAAAPAPTQSSCPRSGGRSTS